MNAEHLYRAGKLTEAVAAQNEEVRAHPSDVERRSFLCELLCLAGNLERADAQLETIERMHPAAAPSLGLVRQLIRAEKSRQEVHLSGRAPEFLVPPGRHVQLCLEAAVELRTGDARKAARLVEEAEEGRPRLSGACDGAPFDDFRDLDDLTAGCFEVLTSTGRFFWIPFERVGSVELDAPKRPLDLLWRPVSMTVRDGPDGKVFLSAVYPARGGGADDAARLGRRTDWESVGENGLVRGIGLRTFLVGAEARTLLELGRLEFETPSAA